MAVTRIRRISRWTLYVSSVISGVILALFYFGGLGEPYGIDAFKNPIYTGELLIWSYILLIICAAGMLLFGIVQFGSNIVTNPKAGLMSLAVLGAFFILLVVAYSVGDGALLTIRLNDESQKFNTEFWLKITDMWLYAMYILSVLSILAILWSSIRKIFGK